MPAASQFKLFKQRRFLPYFVTQALGAFNDNLFKNTLLLFIAFFAVQSQAQSALLTNIAAALFILPFFLFSAIGGQLADKYEKSRLIRYIKLAEILIMACGAVALILGQTYLLLGVLFLMGTQSAFFGPVKFSLLPQHLSRQELVGGNGLVEMGTFVAILGGTIVAGVMFEFNSALRIVAVLVIIFAILGYLSSRSIPPARANDPDLTINWNPLSSIKQTITTIKQQRTLYLSILAISWFWFLGAGYLTQFPTFVRQNLGGNTQLVTLLLTVFSLGVGLGSMLCERLSGHRIELGIVPIGSIGISLFGIDLYFAAQSLVITDNIDALAFLSHRENYRLLADLLLLALFSGIYVVPLNALIQTRGDDRCRAQIIAANNVLNALFMVISAVVAIVLLTVFKLSIAEYFLILALLNIIVASYIYCKVSEFMLRFVIWIISHLVSRVKHTGLNNIPTSGAAVLICNHVSDVDALLIAGTCHRPIRLVVEHNVARIAVMNTLFKWAKAIPMCRQGDDHEAHDRAFEQISNELKKGGLICLFPEGKLTIDGRPGEFSAGLEKIIAQNPVPVIPMTLTRSHGRWPRVELSIGEAVMPQDATAAT